MHQKLSTQSELESVFKEAGLFQPYACAYCSDRGNFVSGPHSHECHSCGKRATRGWYTTPLCEVCWVDRESGSRQLPYSISAGGK